MKKHKWLAALLNFLVPGLGTAYGGKMRKAKILYALYLILVIGWGFVTYTYLMFMVSLTVIIAFWVYIAVSGYRDVPKNMVSPSEPFNKGYYYGATFIFHVLIITFISTFLYTEVTPINFANIPTPSMDPGLKVGDRLAYKRTSSIERNDVIIFRVPYDTTTMYAQRCIGLPGDSLRIENAIVYANNIPLMGIPVKYKYLLKNNGSEINSRILDDYHITEHDLQKIAHDSYMIFLTDRDAQELRKIKSFQTVELSIARNGVREPGIFPSDLITHNWNADFYGPLYIPKKGDRIKLTSDNIAIYLEIIKSENDNVEMSDSGLIINGKPLIQYEFRKNYFFIMGDNRHNSLDSRYWGLLPESLVIGKALYIYWSDIPERIGMTVR